MVFVTGHLGPVHALTAGHVEAHALRTHERLLLSGRVTQVEHLQHFKHFTGLSLTKSYVLNLTKNALKSPIRTHKRITVPTMLI